jgi:hypothetical protein
MNERLENADTSARKGYIRSVIDAVEVDDGAIRIVGSKDIPQAPLRANRSREMLVVLYAYGAAGFYFSAFLIFFSRCPFL